MQSYGADQDVEFQLSGEKLGNIIPARKFVGWYNGLPAEKDISVNLAAETVAIFGQGNVAIDVARILLKSVDELKVLLVIPAKKMSSQNLLTSSFSHTEDRHRRTCVSEISRIQSKKCTLNR